MSELLQLEYNYEFKVVPDPETQYFFDQDSKILLQELFKNDPDSVFLLNGSGFNMAGQLETWINGYKSAIENNESLEEIRHILIRKTTQDVIGFYFEYISRQDIFPIYVDLLRNEGNEKIVYASKYNETLENITLPQEREGALVQGVKKAIEKIIDSGPETIVVLNSPAGWSGMTRDGKEVVYPDNQSYVYWINKEGNLQAITIRTDINLDMGEKLIGIAPSTGKSAKERIKDIVSSPLSIKANGFEEVLDLIERVSGRKFDKIRNEIVNRDSLFTLNDGAQEIINNLLEVLTENITHISRDNIKILVKEVGKAILELEKQTLQKKLSETEYAEQYLSLFDNSYSDYTQISEYQRLAEGVRKLKGCNGGGENEDQGMSLLVAILLLIMQMRMNQCQKCGTTENVSCGWCTPCWIKWQSN